MNKFPTGIGNKLSLLLSLFFLLPFPSVANNIYVTPTPQTVCPDNPCHTLSQYANESAKYLVSNTTMIFLPGEHVLKLQVNITNVDNFSMSGEKGKETLVTCSGSKCGGFYFENVSYLSIFSLSFSSVSKSISGQNVHDFLLTNCTFAHNEDTALFLGFSSIVFDGNTFVNNSAYDHTQNTFWPGSGIAVFYSNITLQGQNIFLNNTCVHSVCGGSAIFAVKSTVYLGGNSSFVNNAVENRLRAQDNACGGGTLFTIDTNIFVTGSVIFANNSVSNTHLEDNTCQIGGGGALFYQSNAILSGQMTFLNNHAKGSSGCGSGLYALGTSVTISGSLEFTDNTAGFSGGGMYVEAGRLYVEGTVSFIHNSGGYGGGMSIVQLKPMLVTGFVILNDNHANSYICTATRGSQGGGWWVKQSTVNITGEVIVTNNSAQCQGGGVSFIFSNVFASGNVSVVDNSANNIGGGVNIVGSNVTLTKAVIVDNFALEGGGIAMELGRLIIRGADILFLNNRASFNGGGITVINSTLNITGSLNLTKNLAIRTGGAIITQSSEIVIYGDLFVTENEVTDKQAQGGGMTIRDSTMKVFGTVIVADNFAGHSGGGWYLDSSQVAISEKIRFSNNVAQFGGAIYVYDEVPLIYCSLAISGAQCISVECFFRNLSQGHDQILMEFDGNYALAGSVLIGGSIDRCTIDDQLEPNSGKVFDAIIDISNQSHTHSLISSPPFRVCLCENGQPHCGDSVNKNITAYPGETFSIQAVTIGQRNGTVPDQRVNALVNPSNIARLGVFEDRQLLDVCSNLNYSVYSNLSDNFLIIYIAGTCSSLDGSDEQLMIPIYLSLPCPPAFNLSGPPHHCICEERLQKYTNSCDINGQTILRDGDFWMGYNNDTNSQGLILHPHCPFDYCKARLINFTLSDIDIQCKGNRTGLLCGACAPGLSLGLGGSKCLDCSNAYLSLILPFAVMGVVFVLFFLVFKIFTVKSGAISGLIFYASIVGANQNIFFPPGQKNYLGQYIMPWIKLDLGIETCFYDGMDTYAKTWLQFVFPVYVLILLLLIILLNKYYPALSKFYRAKNTESDESHIPHPMYVLATFFILAYGKIVRTIIASLSYTTLEYPNDKTEIVWLYDANIKYLHGKHIPLFVVSVVLSVVLVIPYTAFLLFGQLIQKIPMPMWMKQPIDKILMLYHGPYKREHGYWPGLLLAVRLALFLIFGVNALRDYSENLLAISAASFGLLAWPWIIGGHVYKPKKKWYGVLEASYMLNLGVFAAATFYVQQSGGNQAIVAYISTSMAFVSFLITLVYDACIDQRGKVCFCCQLRGKVYQEIHGKNDGSVNNDSKFTESTTWKNNNLKQKDCV